MKIDKELLVACANAVKYTCMDGFPLHAEYGMRQVGRDGEFQRFWNPLEDNGDCFKLLIDAASLELDIDGADMEEALEMPDKYKAVRRVVVTAISKADQRSLV